MTMNTEQLRADFEVWAKADGYEDFERFGEGYSHPELREAWRGYQAGRAALQSHDSEVWLNRLISLAVSYGDSRHFEVEADDKRDAACRSAQAFKNLIDHARALQSQTVIDDDHLSIVLDVYDNAMQKAFDGREFPNPCKPGTPEHKAWEKGSKEGKKKRDAGLPHSIALQSQDAEDAERYRWLITKLQQGYDGDYFETDLMSLYCHMPSQFKGDRVVRAEITWRDKTDEPIGLSAVIDHARRVEGADDA